MRFLEIEIIQVLNDKEEFFKLIINRDNGASISFVIEDYIAENMINNFRMEINNTDIEMIMNCNRYIIPNNKKAK